MKQFWIAAGTFPVWLLLTILAAERGANQEKESIPLWEHLFIGPFFAAAPTLALWVCLWCWS